MREIFDEKILQVWLDGGPLMIALAIMAFIIYSSVLQTLIYLARLRELSKDEDEWVHWVEKPEDAKGLIGQMIHYSQEGLVGKDDLLQRFEILKFKLLSPLDRQLRFSSTIVTTAPLLGLLGTVIGMLATFLGLSVSTGGGALDLVAGGISEALITTQTGLVLALPGMYLIALARSKRRGLAHFITQLEARTLSYYEDNSAKFADS